MKPIEPILHRQQATHTFLAFNTRAAHWQATGLHFHHLHELFGAPYALLDERVDQVAERSRMVDGSSSGSNPRSRGQAPFVFPAALCTQL